VARAAPRTRRRYASRTAMRTVGSRGARARGLVPITNIALHGQAERLEACTEVSGERAADAVPVGASTAPTGITTSGRGVVRQQFVAALKGEHLMLAHDPPKKAPGGEGLEYLSGLIGADGTSEAIGARQWGRVGPGGEQRHAPGSCRAPCGDTGVERIWPATRRNRP
jgi:hypothetical protein